MRRRVLAVALTFACTVGYGTVSHAVAIYDARVVTNLQVLGITGGPGPLAVDGTASNSQLDASATGSPGTFASASANPSLVPNDGNLFGSLLSGGTLGLEGRATGEAHYPPASTASSLSYNDGSVVIDTLLDGDPTQAWGPYTISFQFDWSVFLTASVDSVLDESASALVAIDLLPSTNGLLGPEEFHLFQEVFAGGANGPANSFTDSGSFLFSIVVDPNLQESGEVLLFADAQGAASTVPEPGTVVLLGSGLLGLAGAARRRQQKA